MTAHYLFLMLFKLKMKKKFNNVVKFLNEMELKWVAEQKKIKAQANKRKN